MSFQVQVYSGESLLKVLCAKFGLICNGGFVENVVLKQVVGVFLWTVLGSYQGESNTRGKEEARNRLIWFLQLKVFNKICSKNNAI